MAEFVRPHGVAGRLAGWEMALRPSNRKRLTELRRALRPGGRVAAGYLLMSTPVRQVIERALKGRSPEAIAALSDRAGPWGIALSRGLPYSLPEMIVCLAGLARMPIRTLLVSLGSGSISTALLYAGIGAGWTRDPSGPSPSATCSRSCRCRPCST
jgi:hypothetical protein